MSPLKADLICEIIRKSQCNFLEKKGFGSQACTDNQEQVLNWVRQNAKGYRDHFKECLESFSATELGDMLKVLSNSQKDLNEILSEAPAFVER